MSKLKDALVTLKVSRATRDWVADEQIRLRKREGRKPTHAELLDRLIAAYEPSRPAPDVPTIPGPFEGLDDHDAHTVRQLVEVLRGGQDTPVLRILRAVLREAIREHALASMVTRKPAQKKKVL